MSRFKEIIRNDEELNDLLWINYLDNKDNRIEIANSKFNQLFEGKITYDKEKNFEAKEPVFIPFCEETSQVIFFRSNNVLAVKSTLDYDIFDFKNLVFLDIKDGIVFENFIDSAIFNYKSGIIDKSLGNFKVSEKDIERTKKLKERFFENENIESGILKI